jgi:hypothetical protein
MSIEAFYDEKLQQLETFAKTLVDFSFHNAKDVWDFEIALAKYQISLQAERLKENKVKDQIGIEIALLAKSKNVGWLDNIRVLQSQLKNVEQRIKILSHLHLHSQEIGDALAWLLLERKESNILPLSENQPVRTTPSGYSLEGVIKIAELMHDNGAGFPLINDITSIIRVGDLTFINFDEPPLIIEVKTNLVSENETAAVLDIGVFTGGNIEIVEKLMGK